MSLAAMTSLEKIGLTKLKGSDNYIPWSIRTKAALVKEDLLTSIETESNQVKSQKGLALINLLCDDGPLLYIKDESSAKRAWEKLEEIYNPKGFTTEFLTLKEFFNTSLDDFDSMEEYLYRVKTLADDLRGKNIILPNQVVTAWILNHLSSDYEGFVSNIIQALRKDPKAYTLESLISSLIDEARGRENGKNSILLANNIKAKGKSYNELSKDRYCHYCKLNSHSTEKCFFLYPDKAPRSWKIGKKANNHINKSFPNKAKQNEALITALSKFDSDNYVESTKDSDMQTKPQYDMEEINMLQNEENMYDQFDIAEDKVCLPP